MHHTKLFYSVEQAAELLSLGRTSMYRLVIEGAVESVKVGKRRLIPAQALDAFASRARTAA